MTFSVRKCAFCSVSVCFTCFQWNLFCFVLLFSTWPRKGKYGPEPLHCSTLSSSLRRPSFTNKPCIVMSQVSAPEGNGQDSFSGSNIVRWFDNSYRGWVLAAASSMNFPSYHVWVEKNVPVCLVIVRGQTLRSLLFCRTKSTIKVSWNTTNELPKNLPTFFFKHCSTDCCLISFS